MPAPALKEWAAIVEALLDGAQIVDLRKGGISEPDRRFSLQAKRFWLYPSYEHQRAELLKAAGRAYLERALHARPADDAILVAGFADVVDEIRLTDPEPLRALDPELVWTFDYAAKRLRWKRREALHLLVLRVQRLEEPRLVSWHESYRGCTSWVPIRGLPDDPAELRARPALPDREFAARRACFDSLRESSPGSVT